MLPYSHFPTTDNHGAMRNMLDSVSQQVAILSDANVALKAEAQDLKARIHYLEAENAQLRSLVAGASRHATPPPPPHPARPSHAAVSDNVMQLPAVIERLAIRQHQFRQQGMLRQCSTTGCPRDAFDQTCFREGHMAWCRTHGRIITRTYTSCSVLAEERGDCLPVFWEDCGNWNEVVADAYRDGWIGQKGLSTEYLNQLLFPAYAQGAVPRAGPPQQAQGGHHMHGECM
ncbi:hypothetical protein N0V94_002957 [Neodidymelliopsis sp. IMI 364377]|nr:hypothetical protein N0V94_002957 [Neodidymelliopsis sp. IMI 364377]